MKKEKLSIDDISLKDERFRISYYFPLDELILSIKKIGLINPPLVAFRDKHIILVSGWKRVLACAELAITHIPVFLIEEEDELEIFLKAFYENLATREFSLLDKAEILNRLKRFGEDEQNIVRHYMPLLNIPRTLPYLDSLMAISQLEPEAKRFIQEKSMPLLPASLLAEFNPEERRLLFPLLSPLGQNKKKEILENLQDISRRIGTPAEKILSAQEILKIQSSEKLSSLQKAEKVRFLLKRKRYPAFSSWEESFESLLKKMRWPKEITIRPTPYFEDEEFSVTFSFENKEKFNANLLKLQELASREEFSKIFNLDYSFK